MVIATSEVTFSIGDLRPLYIFMMISCMTLHFGMQSLVLSTQREQIGQIFIVHSLPCPTWESIWISGLSI